MTRDSDHRGACGARTVRASLVALAALALVSLAVAPATASALTLDLKPGGSAFWTGPGEGTPCGQSCWEWDLDVRPGGASLRVGIDHATLDDVWTVTVNDPSGSQQLSFSPDVGLYSMEDAVSTPAAGRWKVRVQGDTIDDARFRMRAKLELPTTAPATVRDELPNLQALAPWDLSFKFPLTNGGTPGPSMGVLLPGGRSSCHLEEVLLDGAQRCLRMAYGIANTGRGPMDLSYDADGSVQDKVLRQTIHRSDGTTHERVAGLAVYHATHQHYHHAEAVGLELRAVMDPVRGILGPVLSAHRKGFAHRDELLREWRFFYPRTEKGGFGLEAGWGDYYEWDRPGNYIDFGLAGDGRYLVRMVADPGGRIVESNEVDNAAYSYFEVSGTDVKLLETGRGLAPWDPCRIVRPPGAEPDRPGAPATRPVNCPPDTTDPDPPATRPKPKPRKKRKARR